MKRMRDAILALLVVASVPLLLAGVAQAEGQEKVTICHAAGLDGTTHYVTLTLAYPAVFGQAGHFYENGTPRAGHEDDYLGACVEEPDPEPELIETSAEVYFHDPDCVREDAFFVEVEMEGVSYHASGNPEPGETVTVVALADEGYVIVGQSVFEHTFGEVPAECTPPDDGDWTPGWEPDNDGNVPPIGEAPAGDLAQTGLSGWAVAGFGLFSALGLSALALSRRMARR